MVEIRQCLILTWRHPYAVALKILRRVDIVDAETRRIDRADETTDESPQRLGFTIAICDSSIYLWYRSNSRTIGRKMVGRNGPAHADVTIRR